MRKKLSDERARVWRPLPKPAFWYADYDYVRLTVNPAPGAEYRMHHLEECAMRAALMASAGQVVSRKPWAALGYRGWIIGKVAYGTSGQGAMLQASGYAAGYVACTNAPWDNVPRLDIQLTHWYEQSHSWIVQAVRDRARAASKAKGAAGPKVPYTDDGAEGATAYIGRRVSDEFARSYNKDAEADEPGYENAIRHEVEYKNGVGAAYWPLPSQQKPDAAYLASIVHNHYRKRGVWLPRGDGDNLRAYEPVREEADGYNPLPWYQQQVAASIRKAISAGYRPDAIIEALGIDSIIDRVVKYQTLNRAEPVLRIEVEE